MFCVLPFMAINQLKAGAFLSYISIGLNNIVGLLYTPYMLRMLGQNEYGLYSLVASVVAYLTILDLGFANAIVRYTAKFRADGKVKEQYEMFGMFLVLYSFIGIVAFSIGLGIYANVDHLFDMSMTAEDLEKIRVMMLLMCFNLAFTFPMSIWGAVITAYENFVFQKLVNIVRIVLNPLVMVVLLSVGYKAVAMVVVTTLFNVLTLKDQQVKDENHTEITGTEKAKLFPTDTGTVVNDFLTEYFPDILDYNFTASVEKEFDEIAEGEVKWTSILKTFYDQFHPSVENTLAIKTEHKVGERILGEEPETGKPVSVKIGRFGPMAQIGTAEDEEKPRFAQMKKGQSIETITLEEVLELFKLPRTLGEYEGKTVSVGIGRFGPYVLHNKVYVSLPKTMDPMEITLEEAEQLILEKRTKEAERHIKKFAEEPELEILNGRYGPYIAYKGNNYKIPKDIVPQDLSLHSCMELIRIQDEKGVTSAPKKKFAKKK